MLLTRSPILFIAIFAAFSSAQPATMPTSGPTTAPTTAPTSRPAEVRAARELSVEMAAVEAEHDAMRAEVLERYLAQLIRAKEDAVREFDHAAVARLRESIAATSTTIADLTPAAPASPLPFKLTIGGLGDDVVVTPTEFFVVADYDADGNPAKLLWKSKLTARQQARLVSFLRAFPIDRLNDRYVDDRAWDGYVMSYSIQIGERPVRRIEVGNQTQRHLERLIDQVNALLPAEFALAKMGR